MDFFADTEPHAHPSSTVEATEFAKALELRQPFTFPAAPSPRMVQALARTTQPPTDHPPSLRPLPSKPPPPATSPYKPFRPEDLPPVISDPTALILDIRPYTQWKRARIQRSINLAVPTTLLRRPNFTLEKLSGMLPTASDRETFQKWPTARIIIVYDADSSNLPDTSNVAALLNKIKAAGSKADLGYLYGGINSASLTSVPDLVDTSDVDATLAMDAESGSEPQYLSVRQLSMSAFQQASTTGASSRPEVSATSQAHGAPGPSTTRMSAANPFYDNIRQHTELAGGISETIPLYIPRNVLKRNKELPFEWLREIAYMAGAVVPEDGKDGTQHEEGASVLGSSTSGRSSQKKLAKANAEAGMEALAMQFYRIEVGEQRRLQGVMDYHSHQPAASKESDALITRDGAPQRLGRASAQKEASKRADAAAESAKSSESSTPATTTIPPPAESIPYFPFSITAGVEKGAKNRYPNIWPFDHARVRLRRVSSSDGSDYINASYIQPRGTARQYIATQGPLPSTYTDFWSLVWEQEVRIVMMLTKRVEGNQVKCGYYWGDGAYGHLRLKLLREEGGTEGERKEESNQGPNQTGGFDFGMSAEQSAKKARREKKAMQRQFGKRKLGTNEPRDGKTTTSDSSMDVDSDDSSSDDNDEAIIRREFELWHQDAPQDRRKVVQFQYVGWPDFNIPRSPVSVLKLVNEVNILREEYVATGVIGADQQFAESTGTSAARTSAHKQTRAAAMASQRLAVGGKGHRPAAQVLVHCSAGVGRTGAFVLIDAILDSVRRETYRLARQGKLPRQILAAVNQGSQGNPAPVIAAPTAIHPLVASAVSASGITVASTEDGVNSKPFPLGSMHSSKESLGSFPLAMESLSMVSAPSFSPPKHSSLDSTRPGSMQPSTIQTPFTPMTSPPPSTLPKTGGAPMSSILQRRLRAAASSATPLNSMDSEADSFNLSLRQSHVGPSHLTSSTVRGAGNFDFTMPREIRVPRHSRKQHAHRREALPDVAEIPLVQAAGLFPSDGSSPPSDDPSPLSSFDEPVRQVLEGMREQRMSMCQSLRQYVFVHRAIMEGAMQILDEVHADLDDGKITVDLAPDDPAVPDVPGTPRDIPDDVEMTSSKPTPYASMSPPPLRHHSLSLGGIPPKDEELLRPSPLGTKRLASPTELPRTDVYGSSRTIPKRPSLKRIDKSFDAAASSFTHN